MSAPTLIACSHGTSSLEGRAAISRLIDQVRGLLPDVEVDEAFVDVQQPEIDDVVLAAVHRGPAVIVPVLLSTGFHTKVDIARAASSHSDVIATGALGPHDLLALVLESRLRDVDLRPDDAIVLAAAGSSDPAAEGDVRAMAALLSRLIRMPVTVGFAAGALPRIADAVAAARESGADRVVAASYVLAPGFFADVIARAGADVVTAPLAPDVRVAGVIAERYRAAIAGAHAVPETV